MKCKRHPSETGAGVCAPCLRDRLLILLAGQHNHPSSRSKKRGHLVSSSRVDDRHPPPLLPLPLGLRIQRLRDLLLLLVDLVADPPPGSQGEEGPLVRSLRPRHVAGGRRRRVRERVLHGVPRRSPEEDESSSADGRVSPPPPWRRRPRRLCGVFEPACEAGTHGRTAAPPGDGVGILR
ncbi:putative formin-like protein 5 [Iris pallida]|uniref:Formin-like protein 5 n=1 Tax=Iris pallida TaxID=29817 RepID=A0AAX6GR29_IRIPA|nr:putative formin-like protein 5 [Iris pallida]